MYMENRAEVPHYPNPLWLWWSNQLLFLYPMSQVTYISLSILLLSPLQNLSNYKNRTSATFWQCIQSDPRRQSGETLREELWKCGELNYGSETQAAIIHSYYYPQKYQAKNDNSISFTACRCHNALSILSRFLLNLMFHDWICIIVRWTTLGESLHNLKPLACGKHRVNYTIAI